jgi:hypothetical protein
VSWQATQQIHLKCFTPADRDGGSIRW